MLKCKSNNYENNYSFTIIILFNVVFNCYSQSSAEWQSDLRYLQSSVHSNYSNLFYKISSADWDKAVDDLKLKTPDMDNYQIEAGFVKLVALFKVGHTRNKPARHFKSHLEFIICRREKVVPINRYEKMSKF